MASTLSVPLKIDCSETHTRAFRAIFIACRSINLPSVEKKNFHFKVLVLDQHNFEDNNFIEEFFRSSSALKV